MRVGESRIIIPGNACAECREAAWVAGLNAAGPPGGPRCADGTRRDSGRSEHHSDEATRWRWGVQGAEMVQFRWRGVGGVENGVCGAGNAPGSVQVGQQAGHFFRVWELRGRCLLGGTVVTDAIAGEGLLF